MQRLLQLSAADLYQLVDTRLEADLLLDAISELRAREVQFRHSSSSPRNPFARPGLLVPGCPFLPCSPAP